VLLTYFQLLTFTAEIFWPQKYKLDRMLLS